MQATDTTDRNTAAVARARPARRTLANAIRILAMDAVQKANSGHPGMPMGMADIAEVLFNNYMRFNPANPGWLDRDRFVVSNGHGCMLQYAALHLSGYDLSLDELRNFRQLHSKTPGHPEYGMTPGVETTTGPLGQGFANAVGMAVAEAALAAEFNTADATVVDHWTYCLVGDGCLMEGISHEVGSLAGHLALGKLILFYDDNGISIDGEVDGWFSDDTPARFEAYGWQVLRDVDGHDADALSHAIDAARADTDHQSLICCKTVIGWGSPGKQGTEGVHGAALGGDEIAATRRELGWPDETPFAVSDDIYAAWDKREAGANHEQEWQNRWARYQAEYPEQAAELARRTAGDLPEAFHKSMMRHMHHTQGEGTDTATRKSSKTMIEAVAAYLPELFGGSADLSGSNGTDWMGHAALSSPAYHGNYLHYGVREFGMTALASGMSLHGGFIPFVATFLTFSDYSRNAIRMAALMKLRNILVFTHDSIGLGEDGPTHQSVEHVSSLRLIPNLNVWRPADDIETIGAWMSAIERRDGPSALVLTRQDLPHLDRDIPAVEGVLRGGYVLYEPAAVPEAIVIATGSEVALALNAARQIGADHGRAIRVVSMPCVEVFEDQEKRYRDSVLDPNITARVAVEAGVTRLWREYVGREGRVLGVDRFGESAPADDLFEHFGLTAAHIVAALCDVLGVVEDA